LLMMILAFASDIYQFYMLSDIYFCTIIEQMPVPPIETVGGLLIYRCNRDTYLIPGFTHSGLEVQTTILSDMKSIAHC